MIPASLTRLSLGFLAGCALLIASPLAAAEGGFTATLSNEQREAAGLNTLNNDERGVLDQLVAADLALARSEKLTTFDAPFLARHNEASRKLAGLDRLSQAQLAKLNELVAAAIAARPTPKERPRLKESDVVVKRPNEIHGSVTVAYGWGSGGREFRAGSLWLNYYDPESRIGIGVGLSSINGDGYWGYAPGYYPGRFYPTAYDPLDDYASPPIYFSNEARGDFRGFEGDGACFRGGSMGWHGGFRH